MKNFFYLIILILGFSGTAKGFEQGLDSVGLREINGKYFIEHRVEKGEGLYAIARRYQSSVDAIRAANPGMDESLKVGQIVLVPTTYKPNAATESTETVVHVVKAGETLYSISRQYNVTVEEIRKKNMLSSDNLTVGQELLIKGKAKPEHTEDYGGSETPVQPKPTENTPPAPTPGGANYEYNQATGEVKESGQAVVAIDEEMNHERSFCLHPTAPAGTIIMVTNTVNNKSVFVRVVGKPGTRQEGVVIYLSKAAGERLGIDENDSAVVKLNYAK